MDSDEVRRRARAGTWYMLSQRGIVILLNILSSVTLARLLPPREFGVAAMATVAFSFMNILRNFGLTSVAVQKHTITHEELNFLFWFNVATTTVLACVAAILSPWLAVFFGEPRVRDIMLVTCVGFLIAGYSAQYNALLRRELRFDTVMRSETGGMLVGFAAGLAVAVWRHDAWAVVTAGLVHSIIAAISNVAAVRWVPTRPRFIPEARSMLGFGANLTIHSTLMTLSANLAPLLIGRMMGATALGFYSRGYQIFQVPYNVIIQPVMAVMMPVLSRLERDGRAHRHAYLSAVERLSCVFMPSAVGLFFVAPSLTRVLLGPGWDVAGDVLSWLAPALAAQGLSGPAGPLLISQGRFSELRTWGIIDAAFRTIGTMIGLSFGVVGAAAGLSISNLLSVPFVVWMIGRRGDIASRDQLVAASRALPISAGVLVACLLTQRLIREAGWHHPLLVLIVTTSAGIVGGALFGLPVKSTRHVIVGVLRLIPIRYLIKER